MAYDGGGICHIRPLVQVNDSRVDCRASETSQVTISLNSIYFILSQSKRFLKLV